MCNDFAFFFRGNNLIRAIRREFTMGRRRAEVALSEKEEGDKNVQKGQKGNTKNNSSLI